MAQGKAVSHKGTRIAASIFALACTLSLTLLCSASPYALADEQATASDAAAVSSPAAFGTLPHILFVSSYDYDWDSVPKQLTGFVGEINGSAKVDYLFMDTKACSYDDAKATTYGQIEQAFARGESYDLIVLGDDAALDFALEYQSELFAGLPLVFEGINTEAKAYSAAQDPLITGVVESFPMEQTVEAARKLSPQATQIVAIADDSESCKGSLQQYFDCQGDFPSLAFKVMDCSTLTGEQITQQLGAYGDDTILLFLMMSSDSNNVEYSQFEAARIVSKSAHIPVFKADELGIGDGLLGGVVISYENMGALAGRMAMKILGGASPSDIPVETVAYQPLFDENVMRDYGIASSDLPTGSQVLNHESNPWERHRAVLIPLGLIILVLIAVIAAIALTMRSRRLEFELQSAETANKAKTDFLSRMSHDMRTPMNGILGLSHLMEEQTDINEIKKELPQLREAGEYLLQLINDVLDVNKIESGKIELHPRVCDEQQVFDDIIAMITPQIKAKNIQFTFEKRNIDWAKMMLDVPRVKQIFLNLLTNAVKFTPQDGKIDFVMELDSEHDTYLRDKFIVRDNGIGMSKEFLPHLFEPFTQEGRVQEGLEGTGLGLSIVKKLVDLMDGSISVESEVGKGTEFTLYLNFPLAGDDAGVAQQEAGTEQPSALPEGAKILLCEDNVLNARIAIRLLESQGADVTWKENGQLGIDAFEQSEPGEFAAILMDIRMPVLDGLDAARAIRALDRPDAQQVPIIALSANAFEEDVRASLDAGMNAHLPKPFEPRELYATIGALVAKSRAAAGNDGGAGR